MIKKETSNREKMKMTLSDLKVCIWILNEAHSQPDPTVMENSNKYPITNLKSFTNR